MKLTRIYQALNRRTQIRRKQRIRNRMLSHLTFLLVATLLCLAEPIISTLAAPGDLDPSIGNGGKLTDWSGAATDVAIQPDGKIVVVGNGSGGSGLKIARYNPDGSVDTTFGGSSGKVTYFELGYNSLSSVAIRPDGKIVVLGAFYDLWYDYPYTVLVRQNS